MIPVYQPWLTELERDYLLKAVNTGWISSAGDFVDASERSLSSLIGVNHTRVTSNGTTALHLCLRAVGIRPDDKVIVPSITFAATAFAVSYCHATPIFVDSELTTWNLDLNIVEDVCKKHNVRAVVPVHLYGNPVDMDALRQLSDKYGFFVIEDACESLGATLHGRHTGTLSDIACFSFYGNKTITCGEGGAVVTNDAIYDERVKLLRGQAHDPSRRYWHIDVGHNYRMTNMQAAILTAQIERFDKIMAEKKRVYDQYHTQLPSEWFQTVIHGGNPSAWMISVRLPIRASLVATHLLRMGIETRPVFYPLYDMPPYQKFDVYGRMVGRALNEFGLTLPSYPMLTDGEIASICASLKDTISILS